jgi:hypothetical protein
VATLVGALAVSACHKKTDADNSAAAPDNATAVTSTAPDGTTATTTPPGTTTTAPNGTTTTSNPNGTATSVTPGNAAPGNAAQ